ncbi:MULTISPECIES: CvfD/Ygs/GSP13 family RNA-binding post-transcriptional regulator [Bacillaceae]|uniref:CvfD/Ygs/GSP13 family RNA-binding post-transcriptional regulator n=1 Tax=Bacillaceae TaxID=186817 RepID=UPI000BFA8012|nr:CvfD/Ygs/GSP13 family RNA-binding post-transcriptional regulator [Bacillus sp. AFS088145]PFH85892.1 RNA-binding protein S1 [Bacillus sp. AFS088145]
MAQNYNIGKVYTGKVTGIQTYGAFISLDHQTQGLVHISEIINGYVRDIRDYISVGQLVNVRVLSIDEMTGKISLSLKGASIDQGFNGEESLKHAARLLRELKPDGFSTLHKKLNEWLRVEMKKENMTN